MIRLFVGYDRSEPVIFNTFAHSVIKKATKPVAITPISLDHLEGIFTRERNKLQSTEFSFSRFLVPYLCDYKGWAIFTDNDFIARDDIAKLWSLRNDKYAVMCVKHDHAPEEMHKFKGATQTQYEKKNWSSAMLINCEKCTKLTPEYVNTATGLELHQFKWLENDGLIGDIPLHWNYLVDYYKHDDNAQFIHFTEGGPYFPEYGDVDFSEDWYEAFIDANTGSESSAEETLKRALLRIQKNKKVA